MKVKLYSRSRKNIGMKVFQENCASILAKIDLLMRRYADKLSSAENREILDIVTQIEKKQKTFAWSNTCSTTCFS